MTVDTDTLKNQLAQAQAEIERLKAGQQEAVVNELKAKLVAAEEAKTKAGELLAKAGEELTATKTATAAETQKVATLTEQLNEAVKNLDAAKAELKELYAERTQASRKAVAKDKLKMDEATAVEFISANQTLSDEAFTKQVDVLAKAMTAWVTNNPQAGNTTFSAPAPKSPPKSTPAPVGPKATNKPAPMSGKAAESDESGESAAEGTNLETVESVEAGLSTIPAGDGVEDVRKQIAAWFTTDEDEK